MNKVILALVVAVGTNSHWVGISENHLSNQYKETFFRKPLQKQLAQSNGELNSQQVQKIVLPYLQKYNWKKVENFCGNSPCILVHNITGQYQLPYNNKNAMLVVTESIEKGQDCRGCAPYLSFFEFEKQGSQWKLVNFYIAVTQQGSMGTAYPEDIKVKVIGNNGDNIYGIMVNWFSNGGGWGYSYTAIYTKLGKSLREVFPQLETGVNNDGVGSGKKHHCNSTITIQPSKKGFFDILVTRKGIREGKSFSESALFRFNGQKYLPNEPLKDYQ